LQDPQLVCRFQSYFGVVKLREIEYDKDQSWRSIEIKGNHNDTNELSQSNKLISNGDRDHPHNLVYYRISNKFWYYLFLLGSFLGHEAWYAFAYSFLFWNVDATVGRRVMLVGNFLFYIGQGMKDLICWPRPTMPPVIRLEQRWEAEYGMPSTHTIMALSLSVSVIVFSMKSPYLWIWIIFGSFCCSIVSGCRLYLGMHSVADVVVGLLTSTLFMLVMIPFANFADEFLLTSLWSPIVILLLSVLAIYFYPGSYKWTPARGETTFIIGGYYGTQLGCWLNYQLGIISASDSVYFAPNTATLKLASFLLPFVRVLLGLLTIALLRTVIKPFSFQLACWLLQADKKLLQKQEFHLKNKKKLTADLFCKFVTFSSIGFGISFLSPKVFHLLGCDRTSYWSEVFVDEF